jgi:hypothetical protein
MNVSNKIPTNIILETIFDYSESNPYDLTHIAVGSFPRYHKLENFTPKLDQILPMFILKEIQITTKTIRIIHIDPTTASCLSFLHEYFKSFASKGLNFKHNDSEGFNIWKTDDQRIEIIFLFISISIPTDTWFLEKMIETTLNNKNQLIYQQYTGHVNLMQLSTQLCDSNSRKDLFKNHILFDITYGTDSGCSTDMTKHYPRYKSDGTFKNFLLYNTDEMKEFVSEDDKINDIYKSYDGNNWRDIRRKLFFSNL